MYTEPGYMDRAPCLLFAYPRILSISCRVAPCRCRWPRCGTTGRLRVHLLRHRPGLWRAGGRQRNRAWAGALRAGMRLERAVHDLCVCAGDGWLHAVVRRRAPAGRGARGELLQQGASGRTRDTSTSAHVSARVSHTGLGRCGRTAHAPVCMRGQGPMHEPAMHKGHSSAPQLCVRWCSTGVNSVACDNLLTHAHGRCAASAGCGPAGVNWQDTPPTHTHTHHHHHPPRRHQPSGSLFLSLCRSVALSLCRSVALSPAIALSLCLPVSLPLYPSVPLSLCPSVSLFLCARALSHSLSFSRAYSCSTLSRPRSPLFSRASSGVHCRKPPPRWCVLWQQGGTVRSCRTVPD